MSTQSTLFSKLKKLTSRVYRREYVRASVENRIAYQIRALRESRGWTQQDLAKKLRKKSQASIARLEDPSYGKYSTKTLLELADAFDVALAISFTSFKTMLMANGDVSTAALRVANFDVELAESKTDTPKSKPTFWNAAPPVSVLVYAANDESVVEYRPSSKAA